jgi:hypothetical protein
MPPLSLEDRVTALEQKVQDLANQSESSKRKKDWRKTVGMFTNDAGMQELFADAMRIREADRKKARQLNRKKRRAKS